MAPHPEHLWAVTSGWDGPFQHEEVIVAAGSADDALRRAEGAFSDSGQPVCRAKMRMIDFGELRPGLVAGPRRSGEALASAGEPVDRRCDEPPT